MPTRIGGFDIVTLLGFGGMGAVFLAYEPLLDREVALKLMTGQSGGTLAAPSSPGPPDETRARETARFLSEAVLSGKLAHAGIIPIYQIGFDPMHGYFYTMRYLRGRSLADILQRLTAKDPGELETYSLNKRLFVFQRVCEAVAYAHRNGIVHRDIKPANVMVTEFGEVLTLDWGLAKQVGGGAGVPSAVSELHDGDTARMEDIRRRRETSTQMFLRRGTAMNPAAPSSPTSSGRYLKQLQAIRPHLSQAPQKITHHDQIMGTPGYLSPEQGRSDAGITAASDVYSLGVTLYELLTLRLPLETRVAHEMVSATVLGQIIPIEERPESVRLPRVLCDIVSRALALKPEDRYRDAGALAEEIALYLEGRSTWKRLAEDNFDGKELSDFWLSEDAPPATGPDGLILSEGSAIRCERVSAGDFRCSMEIWASSGSEQWTFSVTVLEVQPDGAKEPRYEFRIGVTDRPFVELLSAGKRVQRRLDIRLQPAQRYVLKIEIEEGRLLMYVEGRKLIDYQEIFPPVGGCLEIGATLGQVHAQRFGFWSRGAPLSLSFMVLPDRLYRTGRYAEARELYRQLAFSHPDREEGMIGRYKAGLCSAAMGDLQDACDEFMRLEGTMYGHFCALGLAQIGMMDGNIEWAWEALKSGYSQKRWLSVREQMWLAMLGLIESLDLSRHREKIERYKELMSDLEIEPQEFGRVACELLKLVEQHSGARALRAAALDLLQKYEHSHYLCYECLLALCRTGLDESALEPVTRALDIVTKAHVAELNVARFQILRAEAALAGGELDRAIAELRDAVAFGGSNSPEGLWAKSWLALVYYLDGEYQRSLTEAHEVMARYRRTGLARLDYLRLIEGLSYCCKNQPENAQIAFRGGAESDNLWGKTARHILEAHAPSALCRSCGTRDAGELAEALFLAGEAHRLAGKGTLAASHFACCLDSSRERAMITRIIKSRTAGAVPAESGVK